MKEILSWDLETFPFGPGNLAPSPVCVSISTADGELLVASCEPGFEEALESCLQAPMMANTNIAFDMACVLSHYPRLAPLIFDAYAEDRVTDIAIRDMLLTLADTGDLEYDYLPNGAKQKLEWSQLAMEKRHLGIDRTEEKEADDAWRTNYSALHGVFAIDYPAKAREYALADARNARQIYLKQEEAAQRLGGLGPQFLTARAAFALYLSSCWGFPIDQELVKAMTAEFGQMFETGNFPQLVESGIVIPGHPAEPFSSQLPRAIKLLGNVPKDWEPLREYLQQHNIRLKKASEPKKVLKPLRERITEVCKAFDVPVRLTDSGEVSYGEEMLTDLAGLDPVLDEFIEREKIAKLVSTELPRMVGDRVHPRYRPMVKTGRTSSYGNRKQDKNPAYPSVNIQQIDPRVRNAFIASPGHVLCSVDYNFIELVSVAQVCLDLFGASVLADKINAGYDPHAYLGSAIAQLLDPEFKASADADETYHAFLALKKSDPKKYKHWRTMAKPTGLGFPGGLGPKRFVGYAKATFGVDMVKMYGSLEAAVDMASTLRKRWLDTYPEMGTYFRWVTQELIDREWTNADDVRYCYQSPHGMVRRNCVYTEAANGRALQTPTAEGAKISLWNLARHCYDARLSSILLGCHMVAFIHDEVIVELPQDSFMHERAYEVARIMREGMSTVMTRVKVGAEPALMLRWNKAAEAVFDDNRRLKIWTP